MMFAEMDMSLFLSIVGTGVLCIGFALWLATTIRDRRERRRMQQQLSQMIAERALRPMIITTEPAQIELIEPEPEPVKPLSKRQFNRARNDILELQRRRQAKGR